MIVFQPQNRLGKLLGTAVGFASEASLPTMRVSSGLDLAIESRRHGSPWDCAGLRSHHFILNSLALLSPNRPVLSQLSPEVVFDQRKARRLFWLRNPLALTQEFLRANRELRVNETMNGSVAAACCIPEQARACAGLDGNSMQFNKPLSRNSGIRLMGLLRQFGLTLRPEQDVLRADQGKPTERRSGLVLI